MGVAMIPIIDLYMTHGFLLSGHTLVSVVEDWYDCRELYCKSKDAIDLLDVPQDDIGLFYADLADGDFEIGCIVAPMNIALIYVMNIPDAFIIDVDLETYDTPDKWKHHLDNMHATFDGDDTFRGS